jgi:hypothetical protein
VMSSLLLLTRSLSYRGLEVSLLNRNAEYTDMHLDLLLIFRV